VAQRAVEETSQADVTLMQAVDLARPGGFIRVFVDLGKPMQVMLRRLEKQGFSVKVLQRILDAFPQEDISLVGRESPALLKYHPSLGISTLAQPLTPRELEVLTLLREPLSNKEIARKLNISYQTTKRHIANIYSKLDVNGRWDAVARAIKLGILPPD